MEITFEARRGGYSIIVEDTNVRIDHDAEERIYPPKDDGAKDYSHPHVDVCTNSITQIEQVLDNMLYYRKKPYDSTGLIQGLFAKLPADKIPELLSMLNKEYAE